MKKSTNIEFILRAKQEGMMMGKNNKIILGAAIIAGILLVTAFAFAGMGRNTQTALFAQPAGNSAGLSAQSNNFAANNTNSTSNGPGYQIIEMEVNNSGWTPDTFILKTGVPVKWIINGKEINGCNNAIKVPEYNLSFPIKEGLQTIEFTPTKTGTINWSCWMGMISGKFIVIDNIAIDSSGKIIPTPEITQELAKAAAAPKKKSSCGCGMR